MTESPLLLVSDPLGLTPPCKPGCGNGVRPGGSDTADADQLFPAAFLSCGMICWAMASTCSASYLNGTKMMRSRPASMCGSSCSTHSSGVPMTALSMVDSDHDA